MNCVRKLSGTRVSNRIRERSANWRVWKAGVKKMGRWTWMKICDCCCRGSFGRATSPGPLISSFTGTLREFRLRRGTLLCNSMKPSFTSRHCVCSSDGAARTIDSGPKTPSFTRRPFSRVIFLDSPDHPPLRRLTSASISSSFAVIQFVFSQHFFVNFQGELFPNLVCLLLVYAPPTHHFLCVFNQLVVCVLFHLLREPTYHLSFFSLFS